MTTEIRNQIHHLVDTANDNQLEVILELLQPSTSRYSKEEITSFYKRIETFEQSENKGYSVEESHQLIRNKFKQNGL